MKGGKVKKAKGKGEIGFVPIKTYRELERHHISESKSLIRYVLLLRKALELMRPTDPLDRKIVRAVLRIKPPAAIRSHDQRVSNFMQKTMGRKRGVK